MRGRGCRCCPRLLRPSGPCVSCARTIARPGVLDGAPRPQRWGADRSPRVDDTPHAWRLRRRWSGASLAARLLTTPDPRSGTASGPRFRSPKGAPAPMPQVGRPTGASSPLVNVRLPLAVLAQLDRARERLASQTGGQAHRGMMARRALERLRERHEAVGPQSLGSPPRSERDPFHRASLAGGHGRDGVRMHRLRASLAWPRNRFDPVLQPRAAASVIA